MKAKLIFCDICKNKIIGNDGDIIIRYKAKRRWYLWMEGGWEKIDICANCLRLIIKAGEEGEENDNI